MGSPDKKIKCQVCSRVPGIYLYVIVFSIAVLVVVCVLYCYCRRERKRQKTFYGREDKLSSKELHEEEKLREQEEIEHIKGMYADELLVIRDRNHLRMRTPDADQTERRSGIRVMVKKRPRPAAGPQRSREMAESSVHGAAPTPKQRENGPTPRLKSAEGADDTLDITVNYDAFNRQQELIESLRETWNELPAALRRKNQHAAAEALVGEVRQALERMTTSLFFVIANVNNSTWIIRGQEHLMGKNKKQTCVMLDMNVDNPAMQICAYQIDTISTRASLHPAVSRHSFMSGVKATTAIPKVASTKPQMGATPHTPRKPKQAKSKELAEDKTMQIEQTPMKSPKKSSEDRKPKKPQAQSRPSGMLKVPQVAKAHSSDNKPPPPKTANKTLQPTPPNAAPPSGPHAPKASRTSSRAPPELTKRKSLESTQRSDRRDRHRADERSRHTAQMSGPHGMPSRRTHPTQPHAAPDASRSPDKRGPRSFL